MSPQEIEAIKPTLERIIGNTETALMKWQRAAPTVFIWQKSADATPAAQITLQKIQTPQTVMVPATPGALPRQVMQVVENFILQVTDLGGRGLVMALNTQQSPDLRPLLQKLYDSISAGADKGAIDYFKSIIGTG